MGFIGDLGQSASLHGLFTRIDYFQLHLFREKERVNEDPASRVPLATPTLQSQTARRAKFSRVSTPQTSRRAQSILKVQFPGLSCAPLYRLSRSTPEPRNDKSPITHATMPAINDASRAKVSPSNFCHVVLFTRQYETMKIFYEKALGSE